MELAVRIIDAEDAIHIFELSDDFLIAIRYVKPKPRHAVSDAVYFFF